VGNKDHNLGLKKKNNRFQNHRPLGRQRRGNWEGGPWGLGVVEAEAVKNLLQPGNFTGKKPAHAPHCATRRKREGGEVTVHWRKLCHDNLK